MPNCRDHETADRFFEFMVSTGRSCWLRSSGSVRVSATRVPRRESMRGIVSRAQPIAGKIIFKATLAAFLAQFCATMRSGVRWCRGSLGAQTVDNSFCEKVEKMREGVERGESVLRTAINAGVFTPVVLQMVMVGEESGALDDMMQEIADMYQREVEYELKTLGAQIEPILIICLGVLVLILALGVFLPIWDLGQGQEEMTHAMHSPRAATSVAKLNGNSLCWRSDF